MSLVRFFFFLGKVMLIGRVIIIKVKDVLNDLLNFVYLLFNFYYNFVGELLLFLFDRCRGFRKVKLFVEGYIVYGKW